MDWNPPPVFCFPRFSNRRKNWNIFSVLPFSRTKSSFPSVCPIRPSENPSCSLSSSNSVCFLRGSLPRRRNWNRNRNWAPPANRSRTMCAWSWILRGLNSNRLRLKKKNNNKNLSFSFLKFKMDHFPGGWRVKNGKLFANNYKRLLNCSTLFHGI